MCVNAKSLQSCPNLYDTRYCSLPGSSVHGILQARVGCHALFQGIFPTHGVNLHLLCLLHWQAGSSPLAPPRLSLKLLVVQIVFSGQNHFFFLKIYFILAMSQMSQKPSKSYISFVCVWCN